jgi:hypothetical protein
MKVDGIGESIAECVNVPATTGGAPGHRVADTWR